MRKASYLVEVVDRSYSFPTVFQSIQKENTRTQKNNIVDGSFQDGNNL